VPKNQQDPQVKSRGCHEEYHSEDSAWKKYLSLQWGLPYRMLLKNFIVLEEINMLLMMVYWKEDGLRS
jgi:hypothetical protein